MSLTPNVLPTLDAHGHSIPCRVEWVEHLVGQQYGLEQEEVRRLAWRNFAVIVRETGTRSLLPEAIGALVDAVAEEVADRPCRPYASG